MTLHVAPPIFVASALVIACGATDVGDSQAGASVGSGGFGGHGDAARDGDLGGAGGGSSSDGSWDAAPGHDAAKADAAPTWAGCGGNADASPDAAPSVWLECSGGGPYPLSPVSSLDTFPWTCPLPPPFGEGGWAGLVGHVVLVANLQDPHDPLIYGYDICSGTLDGYVDATCPGSSSGGSALQMLQLLASKELPEPHSETCLPCEGCDLSAAVARWRAGYLDLP